MTTQNSPVESSNAVCQEQDTSLEQCLQRLSMLCRKLLTDGEDVVVDVVQWKAELFRKTRAMIEEADRKRDHELEQKRNAITQLEACVSRLQKDVVQWTNEVAMLQAEAKGKSASVEQMRCTLEEATSQLKSLSLAYEGVQAILSTLQEQTRCQTESFTLLQNVCDRTQRENGVLRKDKDELKLQILQHEHDIRALRSEMESLQEKSVSQSEQLTLLSASNESLKAKESTLTEKIVTLEKESSEMTETLAKMQRDKDELVTSLRSSESSTEQMREDLERRRNEIESLEMERNNLLEQCTSGQSYNNTLQKRIQILEDERKASTEELQIAHKRIEELLEFKEDAEHEANLQQEEFTCFKQKTSELSSILEQERTRYLEERQMINQTKCTIQDALTKTLKLQIKTVLVLIAKTEGFHDKMQTPTHFETAFIKLKALQALVESSEDCLINNALLHWLASCDEILFVIVDGMEDLNESRQQTKLLQIFQTALTVFEDQTEEDQNLTIPHTSPQFLEILKSKRRKDEGEIKSLREELKANKAKVEVLLELRNRQTKIIEALNKQTPNFQLLKSLSENKESLEQ